MARKWRGFSQNKRKRVLDRYQSRCYYCGMKLTNKSATIDHIKPQSKGGANTLSNLVPACVGCNQLKADMRLRQFYRKFFKGYKLYYQIMGWSK